MFCAICTVETAALVLRPLGKDDAMVRICASCDEAPPVADDGPDRSYEPNQGLSMDEMRKKIGAYSAAMRPNYRGTQRGTTVHPKTAGWILVRVKHLDSHGHKRDLPACLKEFEGKPWRDEVRYLGVVSGWFLFERPDPKVLASLRTPSENPLAAIEAYRVGGSP